MQSCSSIAVEWCSTCCYATSQPAAGVQGPCGGGGGGGCPGIRWPGDVGQLGPLGVPVVGGQEARRVGTQPALGVGLWARGRVFKGTGGDHQYQTSTIGPIGQLNTAYSVLW